MPKFTVRLSWTETSYYRVRRTVEAESQEEAERFVSDNRYDYAPQCDNSETDYESDDYETSHADDCECEECGEENACVTKRSLPQWF